MNICILDIYKKTEYRISKDQNGQFGTSNDYGDNFFAKFLKRFVKKNINIPPLYVAQVIGELKKNKHSVEYHNKFFDNPKIDLYIVVSSIVCHETEISTIKKLKNLGKKIFVIGPFANTVSEPYIKAGAKIILGEPEFFFYDFTGEEKFETYENLISSKQLDIDKLSLPGWDVIFENFIPSFSFLGKGPAITINASRGCPYSCFNYCVYPLAQGRKLRLKSPDKLIDEMIYFNHTLNVKNFLFRDPVFSINRKHTVDFCNELIKENLKINFVIETHLKILDSELILLLKKAGLKGAKVGVESAVENILEDAKRYSEKKDQQKLKILELHKNNIMVSAMYIIGFPTDTEETIFSTIKYSMELNTAYAQFSVWTPYPGTPVYLEYEKDITTKKFEDFTQYQLVYDHKILSKKIIRKLLGMAYSNYYSRFGWLALFIRQLYFK